MGRWLEKIQDNAKTGTCKTLRTEKTLENQGVSQVLQVPTRSLFQKFDRQSRIDFKPLTDRQAQLLSGKYPDDLELWEKFWLFMKEQSLKGAPFNGYVRESYEMLEAAWRRR